MHFSAKCNSGRIAIQWVSYQALFRLSVYKIPALYLSGAKNVCFCTIRDFGSPTIFVGLKESVHLCLYDVVLADKRKLILFIEYLFLNKTA